MARSPVPKPQASESMEQLTGSVTEDLRHVGRNRVILASAVCRIMIRKGAFSDGVKANPGRRAEDARPVHPEVPGAVWRGGVLPVRSLARRPANPGSRRLRGSPGHRPLNTGVRRSMKALIPSAWSSVSMLSAIRSASICSCDSIERWFVWLNSALALA